MSGVYFLCGDAGIVYDIAADAATGSAWTLADVWPGLDADFRLGLDAAVNYGNGKAYLFRGDSYVRVDLASNTVETEVRSIADYWPGLAEAGFDRDLDAAVNYGNGTVYLFKGDVVCSYSIAEDRAVGTGYLADWKLDPAGGFDADLDAVVNYGNGKLYFFKADCYVRFDLATATADSEVRLTADYWTGLAQAGFTTGLDGSFCTASPTGAAPQPGPVAGSLDPNAFTGGADIDGWFTATTGTGFIDWFNATHANRGAFAPAQKRRFEMKADADTRARFLRFWDRIPDVFGTPTIRLEQFIALQCICVNELGGGMAPIAEGYGMQGHPGIAYLFDEIGSVPKSSYNSNAAPRKNALECFNDETFLAAHAQLPYAAELARTQDPVWAGKVYPVDRYPTGINEAGMIAQADFCKFRGRGMIQVTWREGYLNIIDFIKAYAGADPVVVGARDRWAAYTREQAAFASTNTEWDDLFQKTDYVVAAAGIRAHDRMKKGYLDIATDPQVRHGKERGSYWFMGASIGWPAYGDRFTLRCQQVRESLPAT